MFTVTKGRTSWFFFPLNLNCVHQLKCKCCHVHFYTPSNRVKAQNNEKSTSESSTHLAQENGNCFIQQHTGEPRHSCFHCHAPNISDRRRARLYAEWKDEAVFFLLVKLVKKRIKTKGRGGEGIDHPARLVCRSWMRTCSWWNFWSPEALCHFCVHSQRGLRMIVSGQSQLAPKLEQLL